MTFTESVNRLYYEESIHELAMRNRRPGEKISYNTVLYMDAITYLPDCTVSKLADRLHISKPAVTMKVRELLDRGYIEKEQSGEDKRVHYLRPKKDITEIFSEYEAAMQATEKYLKQKYGEEELEVFGRLLTDAIEKYIEEIKNSESFDY